VDFLSRTTAVLNCVTVTHTNPYYNTRHDISSYYWLRTRLYLLRYRHSCSVSLSLSSSLFSAIRGQGGVRPRRAVRWHPSGTTGPMAGRHPVHVAAASRGWAGAATAAVGDRLCAGHRFRANGRVERSGHPPSWPRCRILSYCCSCACRCRRCYCVIVVVGTAAYDPLFTARLLSKAIALTLGHRSDDAFRHHV